MLGQAAYALRAQGRFAESLAALRADLKMVEKAKDWRNGAIVAANLSEAELQVGAVAAAIVAGEKSIAHADASAGEVQFVFPRASHANALHAAGRRAEGAALFDQAERRQQELAPEIPLLYSVWGYWYCDLLLSENDWMAASKRASKSLELMKAAGSLLDIALDQLTLGRASVGFVLAKVPNSSGGANANTQTARVHLDQAVDGLRASGQNDDLPRGLLARAAFRRSIGDWSGAARDLDEVEEIAEPGPMKLFLCDMAIERARLVLAQIEAFAPLNGIEKGNPPKPVVPDAAEIARLQDEAAKQFAIAADYIEKCGYHRRDEELAELQAVLRGEKKFADLPPRV